jgi:CRISPR-associated protein Cas5d
MLHSIHWDPGGRARMEWFTARIDAGVMYVPERGIEMALNEAGTG